MNSDRGKSMVIAAMIAASVNILAIGALNLAGEASEGFKEFLTFWNGMGSLSGKIALAYALGALVFLALFRVEPLGRQSLIRWTILLYTSIVLSSLLLFTPFLHLIL